MVILHHRILSLVTLLVLVLALVLHLLELVSVGGTNELPVHIVDTTLIIHEELSWVTFYLDFSVLCLIKNKSVILIILVVLLLLIVESHLGWVLRGIIAVNNI